MKKFSPLVSIVIPVYNGANYVREAISSAMVQTYKNIEIIVVNDGSTDNSEEIVREFSNKVRYYKKTNGGVASALNYAIKKSRGEYISWLSHDDLYYPEKVKKQVRELSRINLRQRKNTIVFSYIDALEMETGTKISNFEKLISYSREDPLYTFSVLDGFFSSKINGCALLIPKSLFHTIGYFEPKYKTVQDYDLFIKFFRAGVKYLECDDVLVTSRHHRDQDTVKQAMTHINELIILYRRVFDLYRSYFQSLPMWQFNHFLEIIKRRGLEQVYSYMLSGWANNDANIDKPIIWLYWENKEGQKTPDYIRLCWKTIIIHNQADFRVKILTDYDIVRYLRELNLNYLYLSEIAHRADYLRFWLLYKYGGVWLDSDFVSFRTLRPVKQKIEEHGFVCMGYTKKNLVFPIISFLGSQRGNQVCKKVIAEIDRRLSEVKKRRVQPKWDDIGGNVLARLIGRGTPGNYMYDSSYFNPYAVQFEPVDELAMYSIKKYTKSLLQNNMFAFGQNLANSILPPDIKSKPEDELILSNSFLGDMLRFGLSVIYPVGKLSIERVFVIQTIKILPRKIWYKSYFAVLRLRNRLLRDIRKLLVKSRVI